MTRMIERSVEILAIGGTALLVREHSSGAVVSLPFAQIEALAADDIFADEVHVTIPFALAAEKGIV